MTNFIIPGGHVTVLLVIYLEVFAEELKENVSSLRNNLN